MSLNFNLLNGEDFSKKKKNLLKKENDDTPNELLQSGNH